MKLRSDFIKIYTIPELAAQLLKEDKYTFQLSQ